jgi:hypothetical protein
MPSEAYWEEAMKTSSVYEWHKRFKEGRKNMEDDERNGRPRSHRTDENVAKVRNLVHSYRRLSIRAMAVQLTLGKETVKKA